MNPAHLQVDRVHAWLSKEAYWALGRTRETVKKAIAGSRTMGVYRDRGDGMPGEQAEGSVPTPARHSRGSLSHAREVATKNLLLEARRPAYRLVHTRREVVR